jgi:bifunctional ADP-heptose synthase (sugar kinase/adenylyltransferase)
MLRAIRWVDDVRVLDDFTPCKLIDTLKPDVVVKGDDWISVSTAASITVFVQRTGPGTTGIIESIRRNFS